MGFEGVLGVCLHLIELGVRLWGFLAIAKSSVLSLDKSRCKRLVVHMGCVGVVWVEGYRMGSFQQVTLALTPRRNSCLFQRSNVQIEPDGSSNVTTRENKLPGV